MNALLAIPVVVPVAAAALMILVRRGWVQRALALGALSSVLASATAVFATVARNDSIEVSRLADWPAPITITFVADRLSALMLLVASVVLLVVAVFAMGQKARDERSPFYYPAYMVLVAGVNQAFLAGDLFNLFVAFELLLMASYVLLTLEGTRDQVRSGTTYVVLNVLESTVLLTAVGLIFAATGTVSMAELPERLAELPDGVRLGLNLLLLVAFGIKAAVFPLFFWLPDAYPTAPSSVTAVFAGLLTKVGVYAILRTETLLFPGGESALILAIAGLTMVVGVLGAISHVEMKRILSFHIVSQIGYMVMGIGFGTEAAFAATVFYLVHHIPVKASLFLVEGIIERETGTGSSGRISGLARRSGPLAVLFLVPALSLAGLPPFSGFLAKFALVRVGLDESYHVIVAVALVASLLTLVSMMKIWTGSFWGEPAPAPAHEGILRHQPTMAASAAALVACTVAVAVFAGPLWDYCAAAGAQLADAARYIGAVRGS